MESAYMAISRIIVGRGEEMDCLIYRISCMFGYVSKCNALDVAVVYVYLDFISVKRHGMIDFTLCMYSVYMRDGIKYYKYEEVSTWTVWVWVGIEKACFRCRGIMILDFISMKRHQIMCFT